MEQKMQFTLQLFSQEANADNSTAAQNAVEEGAVSENKADISRQDEAQGLSTQERFEQLIKGEYADAFAKRTQSIIDRRFKKLKNAENTQNAVEPLLEHLRQQYPDTPPDDLSALVGKFLAEHSGQNTDEAKTEPMPNEAESGNTEENRENTDALKKEFSERLVSLRAKAVANGWQQEAQGMAELYPMFSLQKEYRENPEFASLLHMGVGVQRAYEVTHLPDILHDAMRYASLTAGKKTADTLRRMENRVQESSVLQRASSVSHKDVGSMTEKDIMRILNEVSRGAKITF